jgi:hypothetical protein
MYLGSTGQNADRPIDCGHPYPMRLSNVMVHHNIIDATGRGGIMLSGADKEKTGFIKTLLQVWVEYNSYQGNGIVIGGNAYANVDSNTIKNTCWMAFGCWAAVLPRTQQYNREQWLAQWVHANNMHGISLIQAFLSFHFSTFA